MSVVSKEDLIKRFAEKFTGDTSDEVIQLTEDLTDTLEDFIARVEDKEDCKFNDGLVIFTMHICPGRLATCLE